MLIPLIDLELCARQAIRMSDGKHDSGINPLKYCLSFRKIITRFYVVNNCFFLEPIIVILMKSFIDFRIFEKGYYMN